MRVLKRPTGIRVISRASIEARDEAREILSIARTQAETLLVDATAEAAAIREAARREGEREGLGAAAAVVARARVEMERESTEHAGAVISLAMEVVRTVLGRDAASGPEVLRDVTTKALARIRRARRLLFKVHPDDVALATERVRSWLPPGTEPEAIGVEGDATVGRGGVVVESEVGRIDARLERQFEAIERALRAPGAR